MTAPAPRGRSDRETARPPRGSRGVPAHGERSALRARRHALPESHARRGPRSLPVTVEGARLHQGRWLVTLDRIADRSHAEQHVGSYLVVPRAEAESARAEDEWFLHALVGRRVEDRSGGARERGRRHRDGGRADARDRRTRTAPKAAAVREGVRHERRGRTDRRRAARGVARSLAEGFRSHARQHLDPVSRLLRRAARAIDHGPARRRGLFLADLVDLRSFVHEGEQVDDYPYGGRPEWC